MRDDRAVQLRKGAVELASLDRAGCSTVQLVDRRAAGVDRRHRTGRLPDARGQGR